MRKKDEYLKIGAFIIRRNEIEAVEGNENRNFVAIAKKKNHSCFSTVLNARNGKILLCKNKYKKATAKGKREKIPKENFSSSRN